MAANRAKAASLSRRLGRDVVFTHNSTTYTVPANSSDSVTAAQLQQARIGDDF